MRTIIALLTVLLLAPGVAQSDQEPIRILINDSPWFRGFEAVVDMYEAETGNRVELEVTPYGGVLERARNAVRGGESPYDLVNLDSQWTIEFYSGGFLTPLTDIDAGFRLPDEVFEYGDSYYWNAERNWRTSDGGQLMAFPPNANVQLFFYRSDLYDEAGLEPPETWADVRAACDLLQGPELYGMVMRTERGNAIRFDWMPFMLGHGARIVADPENGDFTVTVNSPESKEALDLFAELANECGPPNVGAIGQGDVIQLLATGRALQGLAVVAAWPSLNDPERSAVVGRLASVVMPRPDGGEHASAIGQGDVIQLLATGRALQGLAVVAAWPSLNDPERSAVVGRLASVVMPRPDGGEHASAIGNWHLGVPLNISDERKRAALAFAEWFLTYDAQYAYAEAGGVPVRQDVYESDLADRQEFSWMRAYLDTQPYGHQVLGYAEGAQVEEALGLRLNQAVIGELGTAEALDLAAEEIMRIFETTGRDTGMLPPLAE
jgi:multiple sugar transport system substrate-binding protein